MHNIFHKIIILAFKQEDFRRIQLMIGRIKPTNYVCRAKVHKTIKNTLAH